MTHAELSMKKGQAREMALAFSIGMELLADEPGDVGMLQTAPNTKFAGTVFLRL